MSKIIVLGGGVCGLAAGLLLCRDGHEVTVFERDAAPVPPSPEEAWERWPRDGVIQFRQAHYMTPRGREALEDALPEVGPALEAAGAVRFDPLGLMPPSITDRRPRDGDERFRTVNARRPTLEHVLATVAEAQPGLTIRRGTPVNGLAARAYDGVPHVTGVRTDAGLELRGDLVVDAMGRRSQLPRWLADAGARPLHEEAEDSGFLYYTRFFRARNGGRPEFRAPALTPIGTFSVLTIPADCETWSVTLYTSAGDRPFKRVRDPGVWSSVLAACPLHAQWLEGEPISDVMAMGGVIDRYRRLIDDGSPVATGVALLGDAWACTNPSLGRGMTMGLLHAQRLRDVVRSHLGDPGGFAETWDAVTEAELTPWYRETVDEDRARLREIDALRRGLEPDQPSDSEAALRAAMAAGVTRDPDVFRAFVANRCCLKLQRELWADSTFVDRLFEIARDGDRPPPLGPDRDQLLRLLSGSPAVA